MADVSGNVAASSIWSLESLSHIANLFLVFVVGSAVPLITWSWKRTEAKRAKARKDEDDRIARICQEQIKPIGDKIDRILDNQRDMKTKVDYMDSVFQDNIGFGGRNPRDNYGGGGGRSNNNRGSSFRGSGLE